MSQGTPSTTDPAQRDGGAASPAAANTVGAAGGVVGSLEEGVVLIVPAGALDRDITVTISPLPSAPSGAVGRAFEIGPTGTTFKIPVTLRFPLAASELGPIPIERVAVSTIVGGVWSPLAARSVDRSTGTLSGETSHLSPYGLAVLPESDAALGVDADGGAADGNAFDDATATTDATSDVTTGNDTGAIDGADATALEAGGDGATEAGTPDAGDAGAVVDAAPGPESYIDLHVDGQSIHIDCTKLDRNFTPSGKPLQPGQSALLGGISDSTGLEFYIMAAGTRTPFANGSIPGRYPLLNGALAPAGADTKYALKVKYPVGSLRYTTVAAAASASSYHDVTVTTVSETPSAGTYRISGVFSGNFLKVDTADAGAGSQTVPGNGSWSLLVTYP